MKLKYAKSENACKTLSSAIVQYEDDVLKGTAPFPSALYCDDNVENTLFRLLKLGTDSESSLSHVVNPLGYTADRNNFSLSFHLASCVTSVYESVPLTAEEECTLLDSYAYQLQTLGLWEWAVYIFLCVLSKKTDVPSMWRCQRVKSLLLQNYFHDNDVNAKKREFLVTLGLPSSWFEEALSYRYLTMGNVFGYITHKVNLSFDDGTKALERTRVPNILFSNRQQRDALLLLVQGLTQSTDRKSLLFAVAQFFAIRKDIEELETFSQEEIEEAAPSLLDACNEIEQVFSSYKASEENLVDDALDIVPETYSVPMGSFLAEALHQTSHFKLQIFALTEGLGIASTASQMMKLLKSEGPGEYGIYSRENICRWLM